MTARETSTNRKTETLHVGVLIDESGSMGGLEQFVVNGFNEFAGKLTAEQSETPTKVTLAMFDLAAHHEVVRFKFEGIPLDELAPLGLGDYTPRGSTPLNDAVVRSVRALDRNAAVGDRVMLVVFTDGYENASDTPTADVRKLIHEKEKAGWEFIYLGANQDAWTESQKIGMGAQGRAFNYDASGDGTVAAMDFAAERVSSFRANRDAYEEEAEDLGDTVPGASRRS